MYQTRDCKVRASRRPRLAWCWTPPNWYLNGSSIPPDLITEPEAEWSLQVITKRSQLCDMKALRARNSLVTASFFSKFFLWTFLFLSKFLILQINQVPEVVFALMTRCHSCNPLTDTQWRTSLSWLWVCLVLQMAQGPGFSPLSSLWICWLSTMMTGSLHDWTKIFMLPNHWNKFP